MQATGAQTSEVSRGVDAEALAAEMLLLWHSLMRGTARCVYQLMEELELNMPSVKALHALDDLGREVSVKELAEALGMSLPNASRTADHLLRSGYLVRREDEQDRRIKRVGITDAGRAVVQRIDSARLRDMAVWAATLTQEQRDALHAAISSLPHKEHA